MFLIYVRILYNLFTGSSTKRFKLFSEDVVMSSTITSKLERPRSLSLYSEDDDHKRQQRTNELPIISTTVVANNEDDTSFAPVIIETEKTVKPSPSCSQEVTTTGNNQHGHLDLKFYHSPLW